MKKWGMYSIGILFLLSVSGCASKPRHTVVPETIRSSQSVEKKARRSSEVEPVRARTSTASASATELITAEDPEVILAIIKGFGSGRLKKDSEGDPMIIGMVEGIKFGISFYGCKKGSDCDDVQFVAYFTDASLSLQKINDYNMRTRFGKVAIDGDGDLKVSMTVNLDYGVTRKNFEDTVTFWTLVLKQAKEHFSG